MLRVVLTDNFKGMTEVFCSPPWKLLGVKERVVGCVVILMGPDGRIRLVRTSEDFAHVRGKLSNW